MKRKKLTYIAAITLLSFGLLTGCSNERKENQTAYRQIGINDMENGDYEGAVTAFDNALAQCIGKIGENEMDICYYKAAAQYAGGDTDAAINTYTAIIEYDKKAADAYYLRGCLYLKQQNTDAAVADFDNAIKYNDSDYELYVNIYENLSGYDMAEKGEEYLNKAFSIKGNEAADLAWRGRIYYLLGQYDNALTELKSAVDKESVIANLYLAQTYEAQGDTENAQAYYESYVNSGAADSQAMNALGQIEMEKGDYASALTYLEQGLSMENVSNKRALMQNLIICYEYTGDFASAWDSIEEYMQLYPDDANAQREYTFLKNRVEQATAEVTVDTDGTDDSQQDDAAQPEDVVQTEDTAGDTSAQDAAGDDQSTGE